MKKNYVESGFSLMEMMVVLLIISIIAAASAPMISKKMVRSAASGSSPWIWVGTNNSIAYNTGNNNTNASIGNVIPPSDAGNPRLYIQDNSQNGSDPFLTFGHNSNFLKFIYDDGNISISNSTDGSISIGNNGSNAGSNAVQIGNGSSANLTSIALGYSSDATGERAIAMGDRSKAQSEGSISIGPGAEIKKRTMAQGGTGSSDPIGAIAIGMSANATGDSSVVIGTPKKLSHNTVDIHAYGEDSIALGTAAQANSNASIAIGQRASAGGSGPSIVNGQVTTAYYDNSIAIGASANTTDNASVAIGPRAHAYWTNAVAIGGDAVAGGTRNPNGGDYTFVKPQNNTSYGTAVGVDTQASANSATALGRAAHAMAANSISIGRGAVAGGTKSTDAGGTTYYTPTDTATDDSIAIGTGAVASHKNSIAIGKGAKTSHDHQIVLGTPDDVVFIPGRVIVAGTSILGVVKGTGVWAGMHKQDYHIADDGNSYYIRRFYANDGYNNGAVGYNPQGGTGVQVQDYDKDSTHSWTGYFPIVHTDPNNSSSTYSYTFLNQNNEGGSTPWTKYKNAYSDRRLKDVGEAFTGGLEQIRKLEVFNYTFKKDKSKTPRVGIMAQDLQKIFPNAVTKGDDGFLRIRMEDMFYALVNAVKELDSKVTALSEQLKSNIDVVAKLSETVNAQQEEIKAQKAEIKELTSQIEKMNDDFEKRIAKLEKREAKK